MASNPSTCEMASNGGGAPNLTCACRPGLVGGPDGYCLPTCSNYVEDSARGVNISVTSCLNWKGDLSLPLLSGDFACMMQAQKSQYVPDIAHPPPCNPFFFFFFFFFFLWGVFLYFSVFVIFQLCGSLGPAEGVFFLVIRSGYDVTLRFWYTCNLAGQWVRRKVMATPQGDNTWFEIVEHIAPHGAALQVPEPRIKERKEEGATRENMKKERKKEEKDESWR